MLAVGWKRTTLTDVARRAGVSRMTIYRRWPDMQTLLSDLMAREWSGVVVDSALEVDGSPVARLADSVARTVRTLRESDLFRKIVHVDPELLLPYLLDRRGRTQDSILEMLEAGIAAGQRDGSVRAGDPELMARSIMLTAHGFTLSAETMADTAEGLDRLDAELATLVRRYLTP